MDSLISVTVVRTDGSEVKTNVPSRGAMRRIAVLIGAEMLDTVNLRDGRIMLVDDGGYESREERTATGVRLVPIKALKPVNRRASELYWSVCLPSTTHEIVGDVAIVRDDDFG